MQNDPIERLRTGTGYEHLDDIPLNLFSAEMDDLPVHSRDRLLRIDEIAVEHCEY